MTFYIIRPHDHVPVFRGIAERTLRPILEVPLFQWGWQEESHDRRGCVFLAAVRADVFVGPDRPSSLVPLERLPDYALNMATPVFTVNVSFGSFRSRLAPIRQAYLGFLADLHYTPEQIEDEKSRWNNRANPMTLVSSHGDLGRVLTLPGGNERMYACPTSRSSWRNAALAHPALVRRKFVARDSTLGEHPVF